MLLLRLHLPSRFRLLLFMMLFLLRLLLLVLLHCTASVASAAASSSSAVAASAATFHASCCTAAAASCFVALHCWLLLCLVWPLLLFRLLRFCAWLQFLLRCGLVDCYSWTATITAISPLAAEFA